jgi:RHS repeat-associated protein
VETKTVPNPDDESPTQLIRFQFGNHLGSASLELDDKGNAISYEEYYPYGSTAYQAVDKGVKVAAKRYRYTGKERDEESGLYYHGARHYAPWLGRWISCDPAGMVDGTNLYVYVRNNPLMFADSTGAYCDPTTQSCIDPTTPTAREEALQQSLPEDERDLPPASFPEPPAQPSAQPSTPLTGRTISPPPPVSPTDYTLYVPQGFVYAQREAARREVDNPDNPWYVRAGMFVLGSAATPLALAEEYMARPITNIPFVVHNAGIGIGEHIGRAYLWQQQDETGETVVESLETIKSFSTGFVAAASVAAPVAGAIESRVASTSTTAGTTEVVVSSAGEETVSVYHGSIKNGGDSILKNGLDPNRAPTFVSRDLAAAEDALLNHPDAIPGAGTIIESRIPASQFQSQLAPLERSYGGFYPYKIQSTEITLRTPEHIQLFNDYMCR